MNTETSYIKRNQRKCLKDSFVGLCSYLNSISKIAYHAGSANIKPDALSRRLEYISSEEELSSDIPFNVLRPENFCATSTLVTSLTDQILNEVKEDQFYHDICPQLSSDKSRDSPKLKTFTLSRSFLLYNNKIYIPSNCRSSILNICHDSPSVGYFGIKKTTSFTFCDFWWPSMYTTIKDYVRSYDSCCRLKDSRHKPYSPLQPLNIPNHP